MRTVIELHPKQFQAYHCDKQFTAAICGVQSGKTFLGAVWTQKKITKFPQGNGLICAPTHKILQHSTLDKFFSLFPEYRKFYKEQKGEINLPTGGTIYIRSADDPYSIEGMTVHWAWLDEAGNMKRAILPVVKARVSTTGGQVLFTSTPYNMGWFYSEIYQPWKNKTDSDIEVFTWKSIENPFFPEEYYQKERQRLTPEEFARRYEGEFRRLEGLIWDFPPTQIIGDSTFLDRVTKYPDFVFGGVDWGFHNPTGLLAIYEKDATYYVLEEWKQPQKTTAEIIQEAQSMTRLHGVKRWFPDPAEPDRIEEMKRGGLNVGMTNKDIAAGLSFVASCIREKRLFIHERCVELLDEIEQYQWEETPEGKQDKERPKKVNDHLCDALRYALMGHRPRDPAVVRKIEIQSSQPRLEADLYL